jgi:hypothetical protein
MSNRVVIASLCPWPISIRRPLFAWKKLYQIDAVPKGEAPKLLVIEDNVQYERRLSEQPPIPTTIQAHEIAADFVLHTSLQGPYETAETGPPVWICRDEKEVIEPDPFREDGPPVKRITFQYRDHPTPEEIAWNREKFARYCREVVREADQWHLRRSNGDHTVPRHTQRQYDAANYLMLKKEWLSEFEPEALKSCPYCTVTVPSAALICPNCKEKLNPERYAEMRKEKPGMPAPKQEVAGAAR